MLMFKELKFFFGTLAILLCLGATSDEYIKDYSITAKVKAVLLADPALLGHAISVNTASEVVHLSRVVDTQMQKDRSVELAMSVNNVKDVDAKFLKVKPSKHFLSDSLLTAKAKGTVLRLSLNSSIWGPSVKVQTKNGVVHLSGDVQKNEDRNMIKKEIKLLKGVKSVDDSLLVINH